MKKFTSKVILATVLALAYTVTAYGQKMTVTGVVSSDTGPVVGAMVTLKGTSNGTVTNVEGEFSIETEKGLTLTISSLGFIAQEVVVGNASRIYVTLKEDATELEQVIVVGYGSMARKDVTGAIAQVRSEDLLATPSSNVTEMLRGRVAGVAVTASSGRPGAASNIYIRGERAFGGKSTSSTPLYVIDGIPTTSTEFNTLNPNDIVSVDIFKDAASQAIYGARAADGVIAITTKRGEAGKTSVNLDVQFGLQSLRRNFDFYSAEEWYTLRAHAKANDYSPQREYTTLTPNDVLTDAVMEQNWAAGKYTNWEKSMFQTALTQKYDLSISGGSDRMKIFAGFGYLDQDGMLRFNSGYHRGNVRLNVDYQVYKWMKLGFSTSYMKSKEWREDGNFEQFITRSPLGSIYDDDGELREYINLSDDRNPVYNISHSKRELLVNDTRLNTYIEFLPFQGFTYRINVGWRNRFAEDGIFKDSKYPSGKTGSIADSKRDDYVIDNIATYNVPFKCPQHKLSFTGVFSWDEQNNKGLTLEANEFTVDRDWNMIGDAVVSAHDRTMSKNTVLSLVARVNYSFHDRYLLTASIRRDGSSRFGPDTKWGSFPAFALAWRVSEEGFLRDVKAIDNLKLRFSYGTVGNTTSIPAYTSIGLATSYPYEFGDELVIGYLPSSQLPNPLVRWELTNTANIGLDFGFFRGRINGTMELYDTRVKDMLVNRSINSALGYQSIRDNLGMLKTKGIEISLSGDVIRREKLVWNLGVNVTKFKQAIVRINNERDENGNYKDDIDNRWFIGQPGNVYYDYKFAGIFQESDFDMIGNTYYQRPSIDTDGDGIPDTVLQYPHAVKPGMVKVTDVNGDGKIDAGDRTQFQREPDFLFSFNTRLNFYGFDLYADLYASTGAYIRNAFLHDSNSGGSLQGKFNGVKVHYWTKENPSNTFPAPSASSITTYFSTAAMQKMDYIRLRTVTLGYTFPAKWTRKLAIQNLRVYATATNLWTKTDFLSYSPELATGEYPEPQVWMFGTSIKF